MSHITLAPSSNIARGQQFEGQIDTVVYSTVKAIIVSIYSF